MLQVLAKHSSDPRCHYEEPEEDDGEGDVEDDGEESNEEEDEDQPVILTTRKQRAQHEHIRMKRRWPADENGILKWMVQGQTEKYYTVYVCHEGAQCSCPDGKKRNRCKHIYFTRCPWEDALLEKLTFDDTDMARIKRE